MNLKLALLALSIVTVSANLYSVLPANLQSLKEAIENSDYNQCSFILGKISLKAEHKEQLAEIAERTCQGREVDYANRSHGLGRLAKFLTCSSLATVSGVVASGTVVLAALKALPREFKPVAAPVAIGATLLGLWNLHGMHNAVYGPHNLHKELVAARAVKKAVESKKTVAIAA